jgi:hypothetical protein
MAHKSALPRCARGKVALSSGAWHAIAARHEEGAGRKNTGATHARTRSRAIAREGCGAIQSKCKCAAKHVGQTA